MNRTEAHALMMIFSLNCDRTPPEGLLDVWTATLDDLPFELGRAATLELVKTSPYFPKVAEIRDRARLIREQRGRERQRARQLEGRTGPDLPPAIPGRTGRRMVTHVLGRLADAGQDPAGGAFLGKERAVIIAEAAVLEWLDLHPAYAA